MDARRMIVPRGHLDGRQVVYIATCQSCGPPLLPMPFDTAAERTTWVEAHAGGTGHEVVVDIEVSRRNSMDDVERTVEVDPMPVFVIKAKDALAYETISAYRRLCWARGLHSQGEEVGKALDEIAAWQTRHKNEVQLPDHEHVPAGER